MRKRPLPRLAYEENIQQLLLPVVKDSGIDTSIEYSEEDCSVEMTVRYAAPALDILEKGDELSLKVLKSTMSEPAWSWNEKDALPNRLLLRFRAD